MEVVGENERGFVPIDYLEPISRGAAPVKKNEDIKSNKPFGGKSIFPMAADVPPAAPMQPKSVFPATNNAEPLTNPSSKTTGVAAAFKTASARPQSPPSRGSAIPQSPSPAPPSAYTPPAAPTTPLHSPITAALSSQSGTKSGFGGSTSQNAGLSKLKSAAKSVQSMVHVSSAVSAPRVPSLAAAVDREDFDELVRRNDEYFARLLSSQVSRVRIATFAAFLNSVPIVYPYSQFACRQTHFLH